MARTAVSNRAATRWTVRIIPFFIVAAFVLGTYAVVGRLCVQYLYRQKGKSGLVAALLVLYFLFFILSVATYLRTFLTVQLNPGLVPLLHERDSADEKRRASTSRRGRDPEANPWVPPDSSPDSPGLEAFYSKDVFVCEADGRPKWCSDCRQWKPDRAHHSSELGRCVRKMDHLCPWVGGMVSETSFNFFAQFTMYTTCFCSVCVAVGAYCLKLQNGDGRSTDGWVIAVIVLSALFGFFTFAMALTSLRFIFTNITNIDILRKRQQFYLAVRVPRHSLKPNNFPTIVYPLQPWPPEPPPPANALPDHSLAARDDQAKRVFAILRTEPSQNPWDLGYWRNWKSVMGNSPIEWLLPIKHSPCCNHESMASDYPFGPLLDDLREKHGVPELREDSPGRVEMQQTDPRA
ncbi:DHHC zinc finger protein [Purpureocillium lilacinum]|nr:DHHC zinc finger protein [Purpureocillium lilacinum]OAQ78473.1 DHHC zinc finger protein [Purpureocillium lilacinum]OAQ93792.1 DHHC zinc finger protein [Purpureocillium lilacinum]GJN72187.1 palmitoyltransferase pfa5 [Purpureocillium lilacinum]GJN81942.1 palmitoyltransferase pfa5 [Purpureocillium lilacinum]